MASLFFIAFLKSFGFFLAANHFRKIVTNSATMALSFCLALPLFAASPMKEPSSLLEFPIALISGVLVCLPFVLALEAVSAGGRLTDLFRGAQFGEQISPITGSPSSVLESFFIVAGLAGFFLLDLHHLAFQILQVKIDFSVLNQLGQLRLKSEQLKEEQSRKSLSLLKLALSLPVSYTHLTLPTICSV